VLIPGGRLFEGVEGGGRHLFNFPKSWPDMITFLIHHLCVNNNIRYLLKQLISKFST